jgi:sec-independent protein translocase protein TatC
MNEDGAPLRTHLTELRRRLTYAAVSVLVTTAVAFVFHEQVLILLMEPAQQFVNIPGGKPIYTELTEFISVAAKTSLLVGLFVSLPFVLYQIVMFVAPGLNPKERRYLYLLMPASLLAFVIGAAFGYRVLFPPMVNFLLNFGSDVATPLISIRSYVNLMLTLLFWMGVIFEIPVVTFFLAKIGLVSPEALGRNRRYALIAAFILGAVITPTFDPINQALVALPIIVLYEASVWLAKLAVRGRRKSAALSAE